MNRLGYDGLNSLTNEREFLIKFHTYYTNLRKRVQALHVPSGISNEDIEKLYVIASGLLTTNQEFASAAARKQVIDLSARNKHIKLVDQFLKGIEPIFAANRGFVPEPPLKISVVTSVLGKWAKNTIDPEILKSFKKADITLRALAEDYSKVQHLSGQTQGIAMPDPIPSEAAPVAPVEQSAPAAPAAPADPAAPAAPADPQGAGNPAKPEKSYDTYHSEDLYLARMAIQELTNYIGNIPYYNRAFGQFIDRAETEIKAGGMRAYKLAGKAKEIRTFVERCGERWKGLKKLNKPIVKALDDLIKGVQVVQPDTRNVLNKFTDMFWGGDKRKQKRQDEQHPSMDSEPVQKWSRVSMRHFVASSLADNKEFLGRVEAELNGLRAAGMNAVDCRTAIESKYGKDVSGVFHKEAPPDAQKKIR